MSAGRRGQHPLERPTRPEVVARTRKATRLALMARGAGMTAADLTDDLTGPECRAAILGFTPAKGPRLRAGVFALYPGASEDTWDMVVAILDATTELEGEAP